MIKSHQSIATTIYVLIICVSKFLLELFVTAQQQSALKPLGSVAQDAWQQSKRTELNFPISVQLVRSAEPLVVGVFEPNLRIVIRNATLAGSQGIAMPLEAIVLRGIHRADYPEDDVRHWVDYHSVTEKADGTVAFGGPTKLAFEYGLILPGEEREVTVPITAQRDGKLDLVVSYSIVRTDKDWKSELLLQDHSEGCGGIFYPAAPGFVHRHKESHCSGIVRSTSKLGASALPIQTAVISLELPLATDPNPARTGGLSSEEAARRVGIDPRTERDRAFYRERPHSWFFVREDRSAVALRRKQDPRPEANQKAPPIYQWEVVPLPKMDQMAPEEFGVTSLVRFCCPYDTHMLLHPNIFREVIKANPPSWEPRSETGEIIHFPGATTLVSEQLWTMLERAREQNIELRFVTVRFDSGRAIRMLSAGVTVESADRGTQPKD